MTINYGLGLTGVSNVAGIARTDGAGNVAGTAITFSEYNVDLGTYYVNETLTDGLWKVQITIEGSYYETLWVMVIAGQTTWLTEDRANATAVIASAGNVPVLITVTDTDDVALQNIVVSLFASGRMVASKLTDNVGVAALSTAEGDYVLALGTSADGYSGRSIEITVGSTAFENTYELSAISIPASDPDYVTGYGYLRDTSNNPIANSPVVLVMTEPPPNDTGQIFSRAERSVNTNGQGLFSFTNCVPNGKYKIKAGTGTNVGTFKEFVMGTDAQTPIPSIVG